MDYPRLAAKAAMRSTGNLAVSLAIATKARYLAEYRLMVRFRGGSESLENGRDCLASLSASMCGQGRPTPVRLPEHCDVSRKSHLTSPVEKLSWAGLSARRSSWVEG